MANRQTQRVQELLQHPEFIIVYGDVNSCVAAAMVAKKLHINVIHIESGLRSYDRKMPLII